MSKILRSDGAVSKDCYTYLVDTFKFSDEQVADLCCGILEADVQDEFILTFTIDRWNDKLRIEVNAADCAIFERHWRVLSESLGLDQNRGLSAISDEQEG